MATSRELPGSNLAAPSKIDYSPKALKRDLERVRDVWDQVQEKRDRFAIYDYLAAVFDLVSWWAAEGQVTARARQALRWHGYYAAGEFEPFTSIILCTSDSEQVNSKTLSKWSRALRHATVKLDHESLRKFMQRKGGINACAARFTRFNRRNKSAPTSLR